MIKRFLLKIFLLISILASGVDSLDAQERDTGNRTRPFSKEDYEVLQRGATDPEVITSLSAHYCSNEGPADIYVTETPPAGTASIEWQVEVNIGGTWLEVNYFHSPIGTIPNNGIRLEPNLVLPEHYNRTIMITYYFRSGFGTRIGLNADFTHVLKQPDTFTFTIDDPDDEICIGESVNLVLSGSEEDIRYFLRKDNVNVDFSQQDGDGTPITWSNITEGGQYTVLAVNTFNAPEPIDETYRCEALMDGAPTLTVHPRPVPIPTSNSTSFCEGDQIELFADPDGMTTYTWAYPDGTISNLQDPVIPSAARLNHNGDFTLTVVDGNGCSDSATLPITVNENPSVALPTDFEVCEASVLTITASVTGGTGPYTFAWEKDGNPLGETGGTLTIAAANLSDAGLYEVTVTDDNSCGSSTASVSVGVNPNPVINPLVYTGDVCEEGAFSITTGASGGTGTLEYMWSKDGGPLTNNINVLSYNPALVSHSGTYSVFITDAKSCVSPTLSQEVEVFANPVASITGATGLCVGSTETYDATTAGGTNYEFFVGATSFQDGASATYDYTPGASEVGTVTIRVVVTNVDGCTDEAQMDVDVYALPVATLSVNASEVCDGGTVDLTVTLTTGTAPWSFDWNVDGASQPTVDVLSGTSRTLAVTPSLPSTTYTLTSVSDGNGCSATLTDSEVVTVNPNPTVLIGSDKASHRVCLGDDIVLSTTVGAGSGPYTYRWFKDGIQIIGESGSSLTLTSVDMTDAATYGVIAVDANACESTASELDVIVTQATAGLSGPASFCAGTSVTYTATGGVDYEFFVDGASQGAASATNTFPTSALTDAQTVRVEVSDADGCTDTDEITVTVYPLPVATLSTNANVVCDGGSVNLTVNLSTGTAPWSFTWNDGGADQPVNVASGTSHPFSVTPASPSTTYTLTSVSDGNGCSATLTDSEVVMVNPNPTVLIGSDKTSHRVCLGDDIVLSTTVGAGSGPYTYRWFKDGIQIVGESGSSLTLTSVEMTDAATYGVIAVDANICESAASELDVIVTQATAGLSGPASFCAGTSVTYTATGGVDYEFFVDGASQGAASATNTFPTSALTDGQTVRVEVSDADGCTDTDEITVTVYALPVATLSTNANVVCDGGSVNLTVNLSTGTAPWSFTWNDGGADQPVNVPSGTSHPFSVIPASSSTTYTLTAVSDGNGCSATFSDSEVVTVNPIPTVTLVSDNHPSNQVCLGGSLLLEATAAGGSGNYVYQWYKDGVLIAGVSTETYEITNAQLADEVAYSVIVVDTDNGISCSSIGDALTIDVTEATATLTGEPNICEGTSETYTATGGDLYAFTLLDAADIIQDTRALDADATYTTDLSLPIGTYTLRVLVRDGNGCEDEEDLAIEVRESPDNALTLSSSDICDGETITATATASYTSYDFLVNGTSVQSGASNVYSSSAWTDGDVIKVAITLGGCAVESAEATVTVRDLPVVELNSDQPGDVACLNETVLFTASGGVDYAFYLNTVLVQDYGNGSSYSSVLDDGDVISVVGRAANGCEASDDITLQVSTPVANLVASKTELCANETLVLTASGGTLYEFFRNGISMGAASADNEIEISDPADEDDFYVSVENSFGCTEVSSNIVITVFLLPSATLSSDVTEICAGDPVTFTAAGGNHYSFYIIRNSLDIVQQQEASDQFVTSNLEDGDLVYVVVRDANMCNGISASIPITVNALPVAGINVLPSNNIGEGDDVTVEASGGVDYIYLINGVPHDGDANGWVTDVSLEISGLVDGDELSVIARNAFGCIDTSAAVTINVDAYPLAFELLPAVSDYCAGEAGAQLYLSTFEPFVVYELYKLPDLITPIATSILEGGIMVWNDVPEGSYRAKATRMGVVGTTLWSLTDAEVQMQAAPTVFNMNPTGVLTECPVSISLDGSEVGIDYNLLLNGEFFSGPVAGDNGSLDMGSYSVGGVYTVEAVNPATGCTSIMNGQLNLDVVPNSGVFNLVSDPASGIYCEGTDGVALILEGSSNGAAYEVYRNSSSTGISDLGTGEPIEFGPFTEAGFYRVMIAAEGGCLYPMDGVVEVAMDPAPDAFTLEADNEGHFCFGDPAGVEIRQVGQQAGVVYQLYYEGVAEGAAYTATVTDPLLPISFGIHNLPGEYNVMGSMPVSGCVGVIGSITLTEDPLPQEFNVGGDSGYCPGGAAVIELSGSQSGVNYALYLDDAIWVETKPGNGGLILFSVNAEGSYTIVAIDEDTSCEADMVGQVVVVENPLPDINVQIQEAITGADCNIDATITVENSQDGVEYEIYWWVDADNNGPTGFVVPGDGTNVDFPDLDFDGNGDYKVLAILGECEAFLLDGFEVNIPDAITKYAVQGEGAICEGDAGINIRLSSSEAQVTYVLWSLGAGVGGADVPIDTIVTNHADYTNGDPLDFGLISEAGDYIVLATNDDCVDIPMHGMVELRFNPLPVAYQITGSGVFCDVSEGAEIGLDGSEMDIKYTLVYDGDPIPRVRDTATGSGNALTFQSVFEDGPYTVYARNELTGCTSSMNGKVDVTLLDPPAVSGVTVATSSPYCDSELGAEVRLSASELGIIYHIYDALDQEIASVLGDGAGDLPFETLIPVGTYSVKAMRMGGDCEVAFDTGFTIESTPSPNIPTLNNVDGLISVDNPEDGVTYALFHATDGEQTPIIAFTGSEEVAWLVFVSGSYFVEASWTNNSPCTSMSESIAVNFVTSPVDPYTLSAGQDMSYCSADVAGVIVSLGATTPDVYYELVDTDDLNTPLQIIKGNGEAVSFPNLVTGTATYTITVQGDNSKFSFNGNDVFTITEYITPEVFTVNSGMANQSVLLSGSEEEVWYFLIRDGEYAFDQPDFGIRGTGEMLEFLSVELPGDYYVLAVAEDGGCEALMNGSVTIHQSQLSARPDTLYLDADELAGSIDLKDLISGLTSSDVNLDYSAEIINVELKGALSPSPLGKTSLLTYSKAPSFFGKDSIRYTVSNPAIADRKASSYIIIMAGNKDFGDVQSFLLPNAFSPNGDGINDRFVISGLGQTDESSLEVFNRWGTIVYRSEGREYDNSWDGTSNVGAMISIGKELPNGVYFYVFEVKKTVEDSSVETRRFSGYVELRR